MRTVLIILISVLATLILFFLFRESRAFAAKRSTASPGSAPADANLPPGPSPNVGVAFVDGFFDFANSPFGQRAMGRLWGMNDAGGKTQPGEVRGSIGPNDPMPVTFN